jgi:hypothetical protein
VVTVLVTTIRVVVISNLVSNSNDKVRGQIPKGIHRGVVESKVLLGKLAVLLITPDVLSTSNSNGKIHGSMLSAMSKIL